MNVEALVEEINLYIKKQTKNNSIAIELCEDQVTLYIWEEETIYTEVSEKNECAKWKVKSKKN